MALSSDATVRDTDDLELDLHGWQSKALSVLWIVVAVTGLPAYATVIINAIRNEQMTLQVWLYLVIYLASVGLAGFTRLDFRLRSIGLFVLTYANAVFSFARLGLVGSGRLWLVVMPIIATIVVGSWAGYATMALGLLIYVTFTMLAHSGMLAGWVTLLTNPLTLDYWIEGGAALVIFLVAMVILVDRFYALQARTLAASRRANTDLKQVARSLRESEERYRTLVSASPDGIVQTDLDGHVLFASPQLVRMFGSADSRDMINRSVLEWIAPEDRERARDNIRRVVKGLSTPNNPYNFMRSDGERFPVEVNSAPWRDAAGQIRGMISVVRDVTKRVQTEAALRLSEERFRNIFEHSPIGIYRTTPDGRILMANPTLVRMLGYSSFEELAQRNLESPEHFANDSRSDFVRHVERNGQVIGFEATWKKKDGSLLLVYENARGVRDEQGNVLYYEGTAEDITERVQVEKERERLMHEIQEQAHRIQKIMDTVPEGVILLDNAGQVLLANPLGQVGLDTLAGASVGDTLIHLGHRPLVELLAAPQRGLWHEIEMGKLAFQIIARPIEEGPRSAGWVLVIRDVTQQREIQQRVQRQERLAAVGQLAAGIAHDFNNIMATIVLYAQMVARSPDLTDTARTRMRTINQQAQHAARLIQQILDFSRRSVLERQPFDLLPLFKEQIKMLGRTLPENIEIKLDYGADEYTANADPTRMQQMLTNLALNARDAMPEGGTLRIGLERIRIAERDQPPLPEMDAGDWLKVVVSDTGTGISPDALAHIFEPFFTTKEPGKGTGLGLSQVHGIVGAHEGHIDVVSQLNDGTTFTIYLPALSAPVLELMDQDTPDLIQGKGETILVVEDNPVARTALVDSLEALNYRVLAAQNGEAALTMLEDHRDEVDLVASDVVMPVMGGISLLQEMQEQGLEVKVILLTGHTFDQRPNGIPVGRLPLLSGWLSKPVPIEELAQMIAQALAE